jgi:hypothetical protein
MRVVLQSSVPMHSYLESHDLLDCRMMLGLCSQMQHQMRCQHRRCLDRGSPATSGKGSHTTVE